MSPKAPIVTPINQRLVNAVIDANLFFPLEWETPDTVDPERANGLFDLLSCGRIRALYRDSAATVAAMLGRFCSTPFQDSGATPAEILEEYLRGTVTAPGFLDSEAQHFCSAYHAALC